MKEVSKILADLLDAAMAPRKTQAQLELSGACDPLYENCPCCGARVLVNDEGEGTCQWCSSPIVPTPEDEEPIQELVEVPNPKNKEYYSDCGCEYCSRVREIMKEVKR